MRYVILVDGAVVEEVDGDEAVARARAIEAQANASRYLDDDTAAAHAVVGFAPAADLASVSHLPPRDSVPDALVPDVFKQLK